MRILYTYLLLILLMAVHREAFPATENGEAKGLALFPDRLWALSGDTVWFTVTTANAFDNDGNVIHVQLETLQNQFIGKVAVLSANGTAEGFLPIPDSLATGTYWLKAYTSHMRNQPSPVTTGRLLTVIHRFEEVPVSINYPAETTEAGLYEGPLPEIKLQTPTGIKTRDQVNLSIALPGGLRQNIREMAISATLELPWETTTHSFYRAALDTHLPFGQFPAETNGVLIEGRLLPAPGQSLPERAMVLLSISDSIPYFDYYFTSRDGYFRFDLKNAFGNATVYLTAISPDGEDLRVNLNSQMMGGNAPVAVKTIEPDADGQQFVEAMVQTAMYERIFSTGVIQAERGLNMHPRFEHPFYGAPERRVVPAEFIELPDFREITRELLPAVRFRKRRDNYNLEILDLGERVFFEKSPLRLINGIPVFDDNLLYNFKSSDINYIDVIYRERIFGDISFKGVLSVSLNDKGNHWASGQPGLFEHTIPCLQENISPRYGYPELGLLPANEPDFRRVFYFKRIDELMPEIPVSFRVSDLKGTVVVRLEGITLDNRPFVVTQKLEVQ